MIINTLSARLAGLLLKSLCPSSGCRLVEIIVNEVGLLLKSRFQHDDKAKKWLRDRDILTTDQPL